MDRAVCTGAVVCAEFCYGYCGVGKVEREWEGGMKKDFTRDYVTEIFRVWAATGMLTYDEMRERVYNAELAKRSFMDVETAIVQAEIATRKRTPFLLDIMAAEKTMELLEHGGKTVIVRAVKEVYCAHPTRPLRRGDITDRVRHYSLLCPADTSTVYRWLKEARLLCAAVRGLRISDDDIKKYNITL